MKIKVREVEDIAILDLSGKIMGGPDADEFKNTIVKLLGDGYKKLLLNLAQVTWINSSGLGILVSGFTTVKNNNCDMRLMNLTERVNNLFMITKLSTVFQTYDSEEAAVADFKK